MGLLKGSNGGVTAGFVVVQALTKVHRHDVDPGDVYAGIQHLRDCCRAIFGKAEGGSGKGEPHREVFAGSPARLLKVGNGRGATLAGSGIAEVFALNIEVDGGGRVTVDD
ncbi:hypothetical protein [Salinibacterium sp. PAMC 21357]|uniref:hypothetical protein n=1 Tax=Salinibacterium sp. PAMC 21357 TaxID=1112215 RepID=UPI0002885327|nr:hypothetical protein [Salinibacterium sp. PAMC 21357]